MEFNYKHVKIVVDLEIGEEILITRFGDSLNGVHTIRDIKLDPRCRSCVSIIIDDSIYPLDSGWAEKIHKELAKTTTLAT